MSLILCLSKACVSKTGLSILHLSVRLRRATRGTTRVAPLTLRRSGIYIIEHRSEMEAQNLAQNEPAG
jgi:hypothetical protein